MRSTFNDQLARKRYESQDKSPLYLLGSEWKLLSLTESASVSVVEVAVEVAVALLAVSREVSAFAAISIAQNRLN